MYSTKLLLILLGLFRVFDSNEALLDCSLARLINTKSANCLVDFPESRLACGLGKLLLFNYYDLKHCDFAQQIDSE